MKLISKRLFSISAPLKSHPLILSEEVRQALNDRIPVVALESTIITHGLPYPQNLSMATKVEEVIRESGVVPATCAFINGEPCVGLTSGQLTYLAEQPTVNKVSRRDIGYSMANKLNGGATIASTMILSHKAGIKVFATGGLGGVHKDGQFTMDVSADLTELGRTPIAVICAGPKSILDIGLTMEYLETQGVFVGTYNDNNRPNIEVPGFYCRESGVKSPYSFTSFKEAASIIYNNNLMSLNSGSVFCIPPPTESALTSDFINNIINNANEEAKLKGIKGKGLTPFLLSKIARDTNGKSVECNINFVLNNAKSAAEIAKELNNLENNIDKFKPSTRIIKPTGVKLENATSETANPEITKSAVLDLVDTVIVGSIALDLISTLKSKVIMNDSNPGQTKSSIGGVGYNISLAYNYSNRRSSRLISIIGDDVAGKSIVNQLVQNNIDTSGILIGNLSTAQYNSMHDRNGELILACADMSIIETDFSEHIIKQLTRSKPKQIIIDCNLSPVVTNKVLGFVGSNLKDTKIIIEPTSSTKSTRISKINHKVFPHNFIKLITPTKAEIASIYQSFEANDLFNDYNNWFPLIDSLGINSQFRDKLATKPILMRLLEEGTLQQSFKLIPYFQSILIKLGKEGVLLVRLSTNVKDYSSIPTTSKYKPQFTLTSKGKLVDDGQIGIVVQYFPIPEENENITIKNVTGAGDSLLGHLSSRLVLNDWLTPEIQDVEQQWDMWESIYKAQLASGLSLQSDSSISDEIIKLKE